MMPDSWDDLDRAISRAAPELRKEWDSPGLWPRIEQALARQARTKTRPWLDWRFPVAAAALIVAAAVIVRSSAPGPRPERTFLSERALGNTERAEAAATRSIEALARLAQPQLERAATPRTASYSEKLLVLDSEITTLRADLGQNRFNAYLRRELDGLYREKQQTLKEFLHHAQEN